MKFFDFIKKGISLFTTGIIACALSLTAFSAYCPAEVFAAPVKNTVTDGRSYSGNWSTTDKNYIVPLDDGGYMTFAAGSSSYTAEYFNKDFESTGKNTISRELGIFGAFYSDANGYYILTGQENDSQSSSVECYRLTKYDKSWNRLGSCGLSNCNTTIPFRAGSASMTSSGNFLVIRTCHQMYTSERDGRRHQANVTILVNTQTVKILDAFTAVSNASDGYSSHSFNQYVRIDNNHIIGADHGDAYPRCMGVWYYKTDLTTGKLLTKGTNFYAPFNISGATGDNYTGATLGGLEVSDTSYIIAGSSIVQGNSSSKNKNIFVSTVNKSSGSTATKWLTSDAASKGSYTSPYIVKISNTEFCVIWTRSSTLYYAFIDGSGNIQGSVYSAAGGSLSDCQPVLAGNKIIWFTKSTSTNFAYINLSDKSFNRAFTVTVASSKHGSATVSPVKAITGKEITINIKPDEGYELDVIRVNGTPIEGSKFSMPAKDTTVSVFFKKIGSPSIGETVPVGDLNCLVTNSDTDGAGTVAVTSAVTQAEAIVIPNTVEINGSFYKVNKIAARAFFENMDIKTVYIGANVAVIDTNAFFGCPNLVKVSGGAGLKVIGQNAFARCPKLSTFIITSKVLYKIGPQAFYKDSRLKTVYFKNTTKLTKSGVKKSLKGSSVKTVKVKKSKVSKYRKFFKKSNSGRKVKVKK